MTSTQVNQQHNSIETIIPSGGNVVVTVSVPQKTFHKKGLSCDTTKIGKGDHSARLLIDITSQAFAMCGTHRYDSKVDDKCINRPFMYDYTSFFEVFDTISKNMKLYEKIRAISIDEWLSFEINNYMSIVEQYIDISLSPMAYESIIELSNAEKTENMDLMRKQIIDARLSSQTEFHKQHREIFFTVEELMKFGSEDTPLGKPRYYKYLKPRIEEASIKSGDIYIPYKTSTGVILYSGNYQLHYKEKLVASEARRLLEVYTAANVDGRDASVEKYCYEHFIRFNWHRGTIFNIDFPNNSITVRCESVSWHMRCGVDSNRLDAVLRAETADQHTQARLMVLDEVIMLRAWTEVLDSKPTLRFSVSHGAYVGRMIVNDDNTISFYDAGSRWPDINLVTANGIPLGRTKTFIQIFIELCIETGLIQRAMGENSDKYDAIEGCLIMLIDPVNALSKKCYTFVMHHPQSQVINDAKIENDTNNRPYLRIVNEYSQFGRATIVTVEKEKMRLNVQGMIRSGDAVSTKDNRFRHMGSSKTDIEPLCATAFSYMFDRTTVFKSVNDAINAHTTKNVPYGILVTHSRQGEFIDGTEITYTTMETLRHRMISSERPDKAARYFALMPGGTSKNAAGTFGERKYNREIFIRYLIPDYMKSTVAYRVGLVEGFMQRSNADIAQRRNSVSHDAINASIPSKIDFYMNTATILSMMFLNQENIIKDITEYASHDAYANMIRVIYDTLSAKDADNIHKALVNGRQDASILFDECINNILVDLPNDYNRYDNIYSDNEAALYVYYIVNDYFKALNSNEKNKGWLHSYIQQGIKHNDSNSDSNSESDEGTPRRANNTDSTHVNNNIRNPKKFYNVTTHLNVYRQRMIAIKRSQNGDGMSHNSIRDVNKGKRVSTYNNANASHSAGNRRNTNAKVTNGVVIKYVNSKNPNDKKATVEDTNGSLPVKVRKHRQKSKPAVISISANANSRWSDDLS